MNWLLQLPFLVAMLIVAWAPGWTWLRVASFQFADRRINTLTHIAIAPLITFALITVFSVVLTPARGFMWSPELVVTTLLVIAVIGLVVDLIVRRGRGKVRYSKAPWRWDWPLMGVIAGAVFIAFIPLLVFANPINPLQQWDPSFHYNGVWTSYTPAMRGSCRPFTAPGLEGGHTGYPDVACFHGAVRNALDGCANG